MNGEIGFSHHFNVQPIPQSSRTTQGFVILVEACMAGKHRSGIASVLLTLVVIARCSAAQTLSATPSFSEPSISPDGSEIAFVSGGDIWTAPIGGGDARLLISHPATESRPLYSPDGRSLAFVSNRTGNGDIYLLNFDSGDVRRITFDDGREELDNFSADGKYIYYSTTNTDIGGSNHDIYRVAVDGGTPMPVVADRYANEFNAAPSPDGRTLAFCAGGIAAREWWRKGHSHGGESAIWLLRKAKDASDVAASYMQLSPDGSRDLWPMWSADHSTMYYVSDRGGRQNIVYRSATGRSKMAGTPLTQFRAGRIAWPQISRDGKTIVFERDFAIWKIDIASRSTREIPLKLRGAISGAGSEHMNYGGGISDMALSPDGRKIAFTVHGKVFAAGARDGGEAVRVTRALGIESHPVWSRDSRRLVYVSDRDGPRHLYLYDFSTAKETALTSGINDDTAPRFGPDDALLGFQRNGSELRLIDISTHKERTLAENQGFERAPFDNAPSPFTWSPRGDWIAYTSIGARGFSNLWVVPADGRAKPRQLSFLPNSFAHAVSWSPDGTFLLYGTGQRTEDYQLAKVDLIPRTPHFREDQFRDLFREGPRPMLPRPTVPVPPDPHPPATAPATLPSFATTQPTSQPTTLPTTSAVAAAVSQPAKVNRKILPQTTPDRGETQIVFEDIRQRLTLLPVGLDVDFQLVSPDGKSVLLVGTVGGQQNLYTYGLDEYGGGAVARQLTSSAGSKSHVQFSADGREVYYIDSGRINAVALDTRIPRLVAVNAEMDVDFAVEKITIFRQAWNYYHDNFADAAFNGVDWIGVRNAYLPRVAGTRTPDELRRVLSCMLGELNASHVGIYSPANSSRATTGHLGVRFDRAEFETNGRLKFSEVFPLGPAAVAGIKVGEYLTAIDDQPVDGRTNVDQRLDLKIGRRVSLKVAAGSSRLLKLLARDVPLLPVDAASEKALMYKAWVESRRAYVDKISGGRLGFVHIADMTEAALARLNTDLDSDTQQKDGIIVDIRGNTGGFVNGFAIDVLSRRNYLMMARRGLFPIPGRVVLGQRALLAPTILVTNRSTYSDAEDFTEGYRALKLGKVVGEPTAGAVIFTSTVSLLDGTRMGLPTTSVYDGTGQTLEMHPRAVDVAIPRPAGEWYSGTDAQLDAAAATLMKQIGGQGLMAPPKEAQPRKISPATAPTEKRSVATPAAAHPTSRPATYPATQPKPISTTSKALLPIE
jgi:tricorn protease